MPTARHLIRLLVAVCAGGLVTLTTSSATAQDLFELEVFGYDGVAPGAYEFELHANALSRDSVAPTSIAAKHRPAHISAELTRGWTRRLETALFVQTAPFGSSGSTRFAGGHVRTKLRLGELSSIPLRFAASAEYAFNRAVFSGELQTLEFRSIVDYARGRLTLVVNPSLELVIRGGDGLEPVFDISARGEWQLTPRVAIATDYFSAAATVRHLTPEVDAHHLIFGGAAFEIASAWELGLSLGHCVTSSEAWVMKSIVGFRF